MSKISSYFNIDFFKTNIEEIVCTFVATTEYEQYKVNFNSSTNSLCSDKMARFSTWTSFFDSEQENYAVNHMYHNIKEFYERTLNIASNSSSITEQVIKEYLVDYENLITYHPFFLMYYGYVHSVMHSILCEDEKSTEKTNDLCILLNQLMDRYVILFDYIRNVLVEPFQYGLEVSTGYSVIRYERYLMANEKESPLCKRIPIKGETWSKELGRIVLENTVSNYSTKLNNVSFICDNDYDFSSEFGQGIYHFIDNDYILRQCPLCKGYFKTKRNLLISYCSRIYRNNLTCQDIGAKNKYKEKMTSHPIHSEYTKIYNRLYTRIRRNKLTKENAHFNELKELHEYYYNEYEKSPNHMKDNVLNQFIEKIDHLYK